MNPKRMLQLALTSFMGQGISIITQLLVPPFFLRYYLTGGQVYGEWIALSAAVSYLSTLNYGIQTYATNEMAILYNRGNLDEAKAIQASALRLLLLLMALFTVGGLVTFAIPISSLLRLKHVTDYQASATLYLLIVQMAALMLLTLLTNSFMVVGKLHRGNYWRAAQRLLSVLLLSLGVFLKASFPMLALLQLVSMLPFFFLVAIDLRRTAPILLPSLRYGRWNQTISILKPSGHFGLIAIGEFLTWQGPLLLIQRILGPEAVAVFALSRIIFQMSRQVLLVASLMIGQDITMLVGKQSWGVLLRLYDLSERVVLLLIPMVSVGTLLMCPVLFSIWLHKRDFYQPTLCILMAIVSAVLGIKEHKTQFQSSSNEHETMSLVIIVGYTAMLLVSTMTMSYFGLTGFMVTWIVWETIQTAFVLQLNTRLFPNHLKVSMKPVLHLCFFMAIAFALAIWPASHSAKWSLPIITLIALSLTLILGAAAYAVFGLGEVRSLLEARLRRRFTARVAA